MVMVLSIVATTFFGISTLCGENNQPYQSRCAHYKSDLLANGGVILALWLSMQGWHQADVVIAAPIAIYILYSAWDIVHISLDQLMDRELPDDVRKKIIELVVQHPCAQGAHDLRTRHSGTITFIQLHLELEDELSLIEAHAISDEVEASLMQAFPESEIIIHMDPKSIVGQESVDEFH